MADKRVTLKDLKEQFIIPALAKTPYRCKVYVDSGAYQKAIQKNNLRQGYINTLLTMTDSTLSVLGGGITATALNVTVSFLLPVNDIPDDGVYNFVEEFRDTIASKFTTVEKIKFTVAKGTNEETTYVGAMSTSFPIVGELAQRQSIGKSIVYTCYLEFAFLKNAVNTSDVQFYLDGDENPIPYTTLKINRKNLLSANLYSSTYSQESKTYAENSTFGIDIAMPAISENAGQTGAAVNGYLNGTVPANMPHKLVIEKEGQRTTYTVIFGEVVESGSGIENMSWMVSFVPYIDAEDETEDVEG
jgi:hypothetical protein